eukprot:gene590-736_t
MINISDVNNLSPMQFQHSSFNLKAQQQQQKVQRQQAKLEKNEKKKNFLNLYKSGKQKIMISFYNLYRNYPSVPPSFTSSPIWMMGKCYAIQQQQQQQPPQQQQQQSPSNNNFFSSNNNKQAKSNNSSNLFQSLFNIQNNNNNKSNELNQVQQKFLADFNSLLWFSYRKDFPSIINTSITTDIGWGCMLRTGQMILAKALLKHYYYKEEQERCKPNSKYKKILSWFSDYPSKEYIYSIHQIVYKNKILEQKNRRDFDIEEDDDDDWSSVEEWFSPTKISNVLRHLLKGHCIENLTIVPSLSSKVYSLSSMSSFVPSQANSIEEHFFTGDVHIKDHPLAEVEVLEEEIWKSIIILVPLRLGVDKINEVYLKNIKMMLQIPQSIGFIGGKPKQSFYFVGYQDEQIIYLDPHFVHETVNPNDPNFPETYHYCVPQKMPFSQLDPSLAIGFYCRDRHDFNDFCFRMSEIESEGFPIIAIGDHCPDYQLEPDDIDDNEEDDSIFKIEDMDDMVGESNRNLSLPPDLNTSDDSDMDDFTMVN